MPNIPFPSDPPLFMQNMRQEFDRLLDRVWHGGLSTAPLDGQDWAPAVDVVDSPDEYRIRVEVAGMSAEEVDVSILDKVLTIKGCKKAAPALREDERQLRAECRYGGFCRRIELPESVHDEGVSATCKAGVLELVLPKRAEAKGKSVRITGD